MFFKDRVVLGMKIPTSFFLCDRLLKKIANRHNGPALSIIDACKSSLPDAKNIAFFDTSFHETMPEYVKTYAIDQKIAKRDGLRKYGFHGLSYRFIVRNVAKKLGKDEQDTNIIALHLGSGSSICAIKGGRSIDTS
jgi:acetate kinase